MSLIQVAVPVYRGKRRFHLDKGRRWSVVEHLILAAVVIRPRTAAQLATDGNLPRRLVIEMLVRLMRAGFVELSQSVEGVKFQPSNRGNAVVSYEELPAFPKRITRWMNFVIDRLTGTVFRSRELPFFHKDEILERATRERFVWMTPTGIHVDDEVRSIVDALFEEDERLIGVDPIGGKLVERYAVVTVRDGKVDGLPIRAPVELEKFILFAAEKAPSAPKGDESPSYQLPVAPEVIEGGAVETRLASIAMSDIVIGGQAHRETFANVLRRAKHRIIIHSTFINRDRFEEWKVGLLDAAKRGVLIDILWGEDEKKPDARSTREVVARIREEIQGGGFSSNLRVHAFSTQSHAKLIVADDGSSTKHSAIVGSCNWLSSGFQSFEVSVRVRDPGIVADVVYQIAELSKGSDGHWTELTSEFAALANEIGKRPPLAGARANAALVLSRDHNFYMLKARDEAKRRVFVTSHRLGVAALPKVVIPSISGAEARGIRVGAYYGVHDGGLTVDTAADIIHSATRSGVRVDAVLEPRLHAKILAWDDDYLLVTSQNWLSADPSDANARREIGIYVEAAGVAEHTISSFELMRNM